MIDTSASSVISASIWILPFAVQQRDYQRPLLVAGVDASDNVGALVAVEHRGKQLDLQLRVLAHPVRQVLAQLHFEAAQVGRQIRVGLAEAVIRENLRQHVGDLPDRRVDPRLRRPRPAQARPGGMDKHAAVGDQVMAEQAAEDRVVPGLGQLIVKAQVDQADVGAFDQGPGINGLQRSVIETRLQAVRHFADFLLIQVDTRRRGCLALLPLGLFETFTGSIGDLAEVLAVIVEAIEDHLGDSEGGCALRHAGNLERASGSPELSQSREPGEAVI